ncbi:glycosyltransferase family 4 protein [Vibrio sp. dhg]|uniref:glycosyltransferase family 4 protein n=1 Tax=Vibrio sp. dhg TaxID=2163016 RepID=UPI000E4EEC2A|nr:glycosyltransferase family 4 protein [Vibrio sp. dhg]AXT71108.1 glycosyl transferase [Vibrio sp. dhg]
MSNNSCNEVWLVIDSLTFGGIETHVLELANGLKHFEVPVKVMFLRTYSKPQVLKDKLESSGIAVQFLGSAGTNYFGDLISQVRKQKPALLHAHGYKASLVCKLARIMTGVRQISTYHAGETPTGKVWLYDCVDRFTTFVSNHSIAVSERIAQKLITKSESFNNFIDTKIPATSTGNQIAFVGRLSHEKGPDRFIDLARQNQTLCFDLYGSGAMQSELTQGAPANVRFHGHQTNMDAIWQHIGILIICSRYEGLPMTALEAMARGIPVVSLNVGNMSKLIKHETNGYLVDNVNQLNEALNIYLSLAHHQQLAIKKQAIDSVEQHYSQSAVIPKMMKLYFPNSSQSDCQIEKQ